MSRRKREIISAFRIIIPIVGLILILLIIITNGSASVLSAIASIAVAAATLELAIVTYMQIINSQEVAISSIRPILIPNGKFEEESGLWESPECLIEILNVGQGVALDVWGVVLPPENPKPLTSSQYSYKAQHPFSPNEQRNVKFQIGGTLFLPTDKIENTQMGVPKGLEVEEGFKNLNDRRERHALRLTITYRDTYGRKYASIFDLSQQRKWSSVVILENISKDIRDLDKNK